MSNCHLQDNHIHLTNVAIQKSAPKYDPKNGGKWSLRNLKLYLMGIWGQPRIDQLFNDIQLVIIRSLLSVRKVMINDKHSFELYGYDLLFDQELKVWLLEVNAYPSLSANTTDDYRMKFDLLDDMLTVIDLERKLSGNELQIGGFDLIYRHGLVEPDPNNIVRTYLGCSNTRRDNFTQLERQRAGRRSLDSSKSKK